jgi:hypothetical protein
MRGVTCSTEVCSLREKYCAEWCDGDNGGMRV